MLRDSPDEMAVVLKPGRCAPSGAKTGTPRPRSLRRSTWSPCSWVSRTASAPSRALGSLHAPGSTTSVLPPRSSRTHEWVQRVILTQVSLLLHFEIRHGLTIRGAWPDGGRRSAHGDRNQRPPRCHRRRTKFGLRNDPMQVTRNPAALRRICKARSRCSAATWAPAFWCQPPTPRQLTSPVFEYLNSSVDVGYVKRGRGRGHAADPSPRGVASDVVHHLSTAVDVCARRLHPDVVLVGLQVADHVGGGISSTTSTRGDLGS